MGRTLVVAPWGQPALWREAIYDLDGRKMESCTSLGLFIEHFGGENVDVAILALDSLADEFIGQKSDSRCYTCYEKFRDYIKKSAAARSYIELRRGLTGFVKQFVKCLELPCDPFVIICPAVGRPGGKWEFSGAPSDFEAVALYELGKRYIEKAYTRIVLDLSHGVNFMPAVTLKLAGKLASLILAAHEGLQDGVELQVYNSDPRPSLDEAPRLNINLVSKDRVKTILAPHQLSSRLLDTKERYLFTERGRLNVEYLAMVKLPVSAIYYPLPLALCETVPQASSSPGSLQLLDKAFTLWCESVRIGDKLVKRLIKLDPDAVYALLLTEAVRMRLRGVGRPPTLEDIKKLAELYNVVNESFYYLIMDEISRVERSLSYFTNTGWVPLSKLFSEDGERGMNPDKRIMIAHAGLQMELVEVNIHTKQLRYRIDVKDTLDKAGLLL